MARGATHFSRLVRHFGKWAKSRKFKSYTQTLSTAKLSPTLNCARFNRAFHYNCAILEVKKLSTSYSKLRKGPLRLEDLNGINIRFNSATGSWEKRMTQNGGWRKFSGGPLRPFAKDLNFLDFWFLFIKEKELPAWHEGSKSFVQRN